MLFTVLRDTWDVERAEGIRPLFRELLVMWVNKQCVDASKDLTVQQTITTEIVINVLQENIQVI